MFVCLFVFSFSLPYKSFFGGVSALTPEHYMKMNGFPNTYWGDGGENDDIATRYQCTGQTCNGSKLASEAQQHPRTGTKDIVP